MTGGSTEEAKSGEWTQLTPKIARLIASNSGPFTFTGTCTYIVGENNLAIIDPGPELEDHFERLVAGIAGRHVAHILVTHTHRDHSPLARRLAAVTGAPILGCDIHVASRPLFAGESNSLEGSADGLHRADQVLREGDIVEGDGYSFETLFTPGHTANHLAFAMREENALFSGDHVMGWSTTIVAPPDGDMADYMASLEKLREREETVYYPGHGGPVEQPRRFVRGLINHRRQRETSILSRLKDGDRQISDIVPKIYDGISPRLHGAAALSVFAHLEDMVARGMVKSEGEPTLYSLYHPA